MSTQDIAQPQAIPPETLGDRMRRALRQVGMGVQDMADYLEVSRNTVSSWINDRVVPSPQTMRLWALRTGAPLEWLKDGQVLPFQGGIEEAGRPEGRPAEVAGAGFEPATSGTSALDSISVAEVEDFVASVAQWLEASTKAVTS